MSAHSNDERPRRDGEGRSQRARRDDHRGSSNPRGNQSSGRDRGFSKSDSDRKPRREGEGRPRRDGDWKPRRENEGKPRRDGEWKPRREGEGRPRRDGDWKPRRDGEVGARRDGGWKPRGDGEGRPQRRDGDWKPRRVNEGKPRRDGEWKPRRVNEGKPRRDGEWKPRRDGDWKPRRDDKGRPQHRDGDWKPRRDGEGGARRDGGWKPRGDGEGRPQRRDGDWKPRREGDDRGRRDGGYRDGGRRDDTRRDWGRREEGRSGDRQSYGRGGTRGAGRSDRGGSDRTYTEAERLEHSLRPVREHHDDPQIPEEITPRDLHPGARNELKTLDKEVAEHVARHLAMVSQLIDTDPELAHQHAISAMRRAGRIPVTRETLAVTSYVNGDYAGALRELRTYRRLSGSDLQLALMIDSERALGRPEKAVETGRSVDISKLPTDVRVQVAIAMSGARLDLGQTLQALYELEIPELNPNRAFEWSPELFAAYAAVLEELGRESEAETWRKRADVAEAALLEHHGGETLEVIEIDEIEDHAANDHDAEHVEQDPADTVEPEPSSPFTDGETKEESETSEAQ